jgi:signal peptidase I
MEPTLTNDVLILTKTFRFPYRSQIVTFRDPINFADTLIKRVIAVKRDHLKISEGSIYLNGESLEEPYIEGLPKTMNIEEAFDWSLEDDSVIVLSDNRVSGNLDSRVLGPIKCEHILEELVIKLWPIQFRNP